MLNKISSKGTPTSSLMAMVHRYALGINMHRGTIQKVPITMVMSKNHLLVNSTHSIFKLEEEDIYCIYLSTLFCYIIGLKWKEVLHLTEVG